MQYCERSEQYVISVTCLSGLYNAAAECRCHCPMSWPGHSLCCLQGVSDTSSSLTLHTLTAVSSYFLPSGHLFLSLFLHHWSSQHPDICDTWRIVPVLFLISVRHSLIKVTSSDAIHLLSITSVRDLINVGKVSTLSNFTIRT